MSITYVSKKARASISCYWSESLILALSLMTIKNQWIDISFDLIAYLRRRFSLHLVFEIENVTLSSWSGEKVDHWRNLSILLKWWISTNFSAVINRKRISTRVNISIFGSADKYLVPKVLILNWTRTIIFSIMQNFLPIGWKIIKFYINEDFFFLRLISC